MEENKQEQRPQYFYFNDDGKLVVESNKGVWVDGEQYVKMYGNFVCNAKTMGEIIHQLKGIAVEVGEVKYVNDEDIENNYFGDITFDDKYVVSRTRCVLGASEERIKEYERELAEKYYVNDEIKKLSKQFNDASDRELAERKAIERFNRLPWWKRIFKKIEIKTN